VLLGQPFAADGPNFTTAQQDETTPLLRSLGADGITYSTVQQVANQQTVRMIPINDISPTDREAVRTGAYPISRVVYLAAKQQTSPALKQFIDMVLSPQGQQIVERVGFLPL
jgi:phosphate transport system substrate-binding protein